MKLSEFAAQAARGDWTLDDDQGDPLVTVRQPSESVMAALAKAWDAIEDREERGELFLKTVTGGAYDDIMAITEDMPAGTREAVFGDLVKHFELGN